MKWQAHKGGFCHCFFKLPAGFINTYLFDKDIVKVSYFDLKLGFVSNNLLSSLSPHVVYSHAVLSDTLNRKKRKWNYQSTNGFVDFIIYSGILL